MEMQVLAWDRKQKTTETDGNVGFGMGQETENDRDMEMQVLPWDRKQKTTETDGNVGLAWDRKQKTTETDRNVGFGMAQETENNRD